MFYLGPMRRPTYIETTCKTAINRVRGMPFAWSLNPYRGCVHGCHYCYARATHPHLGLGAGDDFSTKIVVKANVVAVLRAELGRPGWKRERVAIGTATDAYQPCEGRYRLTRGILEAMVDHRSPANVVTKSTLVVRDADLLAELARVAGATVHFTVTTLDPAIWRLMEPGTPPPSKRLEVMRRLADAGVPVGVFLAPLLPGITDSAASIETVAAAARNHGAESFWVSPLRLAPLVREHYLGAIAASFPELLPRYERAFGGTNAPPDYIRAIERRVARVRERNGFAGASGGDRIAGTGRPPDQIGGMSGSVGQLPLPLPLPR